METLIRGIVETSSRDAVKKALEEIIEDKILDKSPLRELSGFQRSAEFRLSEEKAELILAHFHTFTNLLADRIESSIEASFPEIGLRIEPNHTNSPYTLVIRDPSSQIAAEWKWK